MGFFQRWSKKAWIVGFGIGVIFLIIGAYMDQFERFYRKAIMICLECIGIG